MRRNTENAVATISRHYHRSFAKEAHVECFRHLKRVVKNVRLMLIAEQMCTNCFEYRHQMSRRKKIAQNPLVF